MKKEFSCFLLLSLILCFLTDPIHAQSVIYVQGTITSDTTWNADTVKVTGDIIIYPYATLTIEHGTYVKFMGHYNIQISGILNAEGIAGDSIVFTINDTTGFSNFSDNLGGWAGLNFKGEPDDTSRLSFCKISRVKYNQLYEIMDVGAIYIGGGHNLVVSNCVIENNIAEKGGAIGGGSTLGEYDSHASCIIRNSLIRGNYCNETGGGIHDGGLHSRIIHNTITNNVAASWGGGIILYHSNGIVRGNYISGNKAGSGGGIFVREANPAIEDNIIEGNHAIAGGGLYCELNSEARIVRNQFINNTGSGIRSSGANPIIINNIISNNESGGGINLSRSDPVLINNTITNNSGYGLHCDDSKVQIINTILWGNSDQVYIGDNFSSPDIFYSLIQGGKAGFILSGSTTFQGKYENNLEENPDFVNPSSGVGIQPDALDANWACFPYSPCVNTGKSDMEEISLPGLDIYGNARIIHGRIDIGAAETHIEKITVNGAVANDTSWVADTVEVTGDIYVPDSIKLNIAPGTRVMMKGHFKIDVHGVLLAQGNEKDSIHFFVSDTTGFTNKDSISGSWGGIDFNNGDTGANGAMNDNDSSVFSYCIIRYVKDTTIGGALYIDHFSKIRIENSLIQNNYADWGGGGIYCSNSNIYIHNCEISNNFGSTGGGFHLDESDIVLKNSNIKNNLASWGGAGIYMGKSSPKIENCIFLYNNVGSGAGGGIYSFYSNPMITLCKICNNISDSQGGGLYCSGGKPILINNLVANNRYGLVFHGAEVLIINNTITNNFSSNLGIHKCTSQIYNNIFWGITGSVISMSGTNSNANFYNNIIQDGISPYDFNLGIIKDFINNLDTTPHFINPSQGIGDDYDGISADWSVDLFSPCINAGTMNIPGVSIPICDLQGQPRFNAGIIDIGAYENQGKLPVITQQLSGATRCIGDQISFSVEVADTVHYQWQRNGMDIPGAINNHLTYDSLILENEGLYRCMVKNSYGTVTSNEVYLIVKSPPEILVEPSDLWLQKNIEAKLVVDATGSIPMNYQWLKDEINIAGAISPEYIIRNADYNNEGAYKCIIINSCGADTSRNAYLYLTPQLCMVTVSTISGNNLVIWEKNSKAPLTAFNIYRESTAAGIYDLMGTVPFNDISVFEDSTADATKRAYIYKITGIDTSGTETDIGLCKPHKTIHLLVSTNPELKSTQLAWDKYYGFDYQTYSIYRSITGANFAVIDAMPSSLNSWTDPESLTGALYYRVAVEKPIPCIPLSNGKKADQGPYSHSMSNMDDNRLQSGEYPPDTLILTNHYIDENNSIGKLIGRFLTTDPDTNEAFTYTLVGGDGDDDNMSFTLLADLLITADYFDYETKNQYSIRVRSTDKTGNIIEGIFIIYVNDLSEPTGMNFPSGQQVIIYPNPLRDVSTIIFPNPAGSEYTLLIMNLSGKVVRRIENITTSSFLIERGDTESGYYLIELKGNKVYRGKMVIE
ncbi:MAG: hypothetical protein AMS27_10595 [Bacteroides sp. SM23_62_1]|nr:MAG: hypothetical protein AMS27_10595 [Bacteroides sp. SM23_62_1]